ncbi:YjgN family protein [Mesorhizobium sp. NPDC059054]|uniref:YjgN family protein n=1 Tax=Mesorhizobium sp. NPDC059054 TaxID=3346711 RepID=UPI0036CB40C5
MTSIQWGREGQAEAAADRNVPGALERFSFKGQAGEYFGIWIVNVLLTIITLGIYSAWAKVRRQRYFYGNTYLAGSSFEYHAKPKQILIGRIIVIVILIVYNVLLNLFPIVGLLFALGFFLAIPWFIMRGLRFNARVTSYRNVRLNFNGSYWGAFRAFILSSVVAGLSLGILAPFASRWSWCYLLDNLTYGDRPISSNPRIGDLYKPWWLSAILTVVGLAVIVFVVAAIGSAYGAFEAPGSIMSVVPLGLLVGLFLVYSLPVLLYKAGVRNVVLNATVLDHRHCFMSEVGRWRYAWIAITNFLATIFTLGLARPWAAVRMARYLADHTGLHVVGSLDNYLSTVRDTGSAVGAEFMDIEGFDFGF